MYKGGFRRPYFLGKEEVFSNAVFRYLLNGVRAIPLDRSRGDVGALKKAKDILERDEVLTLFPEGTRARGRVLRPKPGIGFLAAHTGSPVVPVRVWGTERYPRERLRLKFGRPRTFGAAESKGAYQEIADAVMQDIRAMEWESPSRKEL
jgi:1-acyl-sn-glycerol-3-phosphate acyltransferase